MEPATNVVKTYAGTEEPHGGPLSGYMSLRSAGHEWTLFKPLRTVCEAPGSLGFGAQKATRGHGPVSQRKTRFHSVLLECFAGRSVG
jgi:hypothetical protein